MKLNTLLGNLEEYEKSGYDNLKITSITDDSRKVKRGGIFVAVKGLNVDGHEFIEEAIKNGVVAVVGESRPKRSWLKDVLYIKVPDSRRALGLIASAWFGNPSSKLKVIGVTGTDGKTTTSSLIAHILNRTGKKTGLITSVSAKIGKKEYDTGFHVTNPEPIPLQEFLARMVNEKCRFAVLEVTSHGLDQERVAGVTFDLGVLTNITDEHLDYHKTWEEYFNSKAKLFKNVSIAVLNNDDEKVYKMLQEEISPSTSIVSYGIKAKDPNFFGSGIETVDFGTQFLLSVGKKTYKARTKLLGDYNVSNTLAAVAAARSFGVSWEDIKASVHSFKAPPGRLEKIKNNKGIKIYIDFAHTPNSLKSVLTLLKGRLKKGSKLISVFGSAGERDVAKRPIMGEISGKLADISVVTAEDPRSEDVDEIIEQIAYGARKAKAKQLEFNRSTDLDKWIKGRCFIKIPERGEAIALAIQKLAKKGDIVVICGKGHEKSMAYNGVEHPWNDLDFVKKILKAGSKKTAIILAAGKGTRFKSKEPKNLHEIAGRPMISYELENLRKALFGQIIVVVGYKAEVIKKYIGPAVSYAHQKTRQGTGRAAYLGAKLADSVKDVFILYGDDGAFYQPEVFSKVHKLHTGNKATVTFVGVKVKDPRGFGRVVYKNNKLIGIVEEKDATGRQKKIRQINDGIYVIDRKWLLETVPKIEKKAQGEYLLTDIVEIALAEGKKVEVFRLPNSDQWFGVNTKEQLAKADKKMRARLKAVLPS